MITHLGKLVHYTTADGEILPAFICNVEQYPIVNLAALDSFGRPSGLTSVNQAPQRCLAGDLFARGCWQWPGVEV